jgi:predicted TIM-barrel fold metal-dependent hydrolase
MSGINGYTVIDFHIHVQPWHMLKPANREKMRAGRAKTPGGIEEFEKLEAMMEDPQICLRILDEQGISKVGMINYISPDVMGFTMETNDWIVEYSKAAPDRLIPWGGIHPEYTENAEKDMDYILGDLGIKGVKIHPPHQLIAPNAYLDGLDALRVCYAKCQEYGVPVMFHTGTSIFTGARIKYGHPILIDDVAVDFPDLTIVMAHGGRPLWMTEAIYLTRRHPNVYIDLSSIPPKALLRYFPDLERIADKAIWGTDWPAPAVPGMRKNVEDFLALGLSEEANRKILSENALAIHSYLA